jgi:hypothetical protein
MLITCLWKLTSIQFSSDLLLSLVNFRSRSLSPLVACVGDSFFSNSFIQIKAKNVCAQLSWRRGKVNNAWDASGSEQHQTEAIPYYSFDLLRNFFIVEVGEQQVSFVLFAVAILRENLLISFPSRAFECARNVMSISRGGVDNNFPLFRLKHGKVEKQTVFRIDERSWFKSNYSRREKRNWINA